MDGMTMPKEVQITLQTKQEQLKAGIWDHQILYEKLKENPGSAELQKLMLDVQERIVVIGLAQKSILERIRKEYKTYQKNLKATTVKNGIEDRRFNLTSALSRARKQNIITRSTSAHSSLSEDSPNPSSPPTPEPVTNPLSPHELSQTDFLKYFGLATHETYKEMQNKRAERKRRSTANPQFLYTKGWDMSSKRKRNAYLSQNISPPNTRQSVRNRNKMERAGSPKNSSRPCSPTEQVKKLIQPFPSIPNLPSGLTIERIQPAHSDLLDTKHCVECRLSGSLLTCDICTSRFHLSCHNRPFTQSPRQCPKCLNNKENQTTGEAIKVSLVSSEISDKLQEKKALLEKNKNLTAELTQLQDHHSQLTISLRNQEHEREELLMTQQSAEDKIKQILTFITNMKSSTSENGSKSEEKV